MTNDEKIAALIEAGEKYDYICHEMGDAIGNSRVSTEVLNAIPAIKAMYEENKRLQEAHNDTLQMYAAAQKSLSEYRAEVDRLREIAEEMEKALENLYEESGAIADMSGLMELRLDKAEQVLTKFNAMKGKSDDPR